MYCRIPGYSSIQLDLSLLQGYFFCLSLKLIPKCSGFHQILASYLNPPTRQGISLPQNSYSYCCRSPDLIPQPHQSLRSGSNRILNYWHWAGVSPYTSDFSLAGTCVFDKQSLSGFCCVPISCETGKDILLTYVQLYCRVPEGQFSRSPLYTQLAHLCWFVVRILYVPFTSIFLKIENFHLRFVTRLCSPANLSAGPSRIRQLTDRNRSGFSYSHYLVTLTRIYLAEYSHSVHP